MKKRIIGGFAAIFMTGLTVSVITPAAPRDRDSSARVVTAQPKHELAAIARGRYIVKTAGCNDCHTGHAQTSGNVPESLWITGGPVEHFPV